jgi:hypothetical protein
MEERYPKPTLVLLGFLFIILSCGGEGGGEGTLTDTASIRILIRFPEEASTREATTRQSVQDIASITITIEDGFPTIERTFDISELPISERIFVPVGKNRTATARAKDVNGLLVAMGSAIFDVFPGESNDVTIQLEFVEEEKCDDGIDNNDNGLTDCADPFCDGEVCDAGNDASRCTDGECVTPVPTPTPTPSPIELICFDSLDNDGDGPVDCVDPDCEGRACVIRTTVGRCVNGICRAADLVPSISSPCRLVVTVRNQGDLNAPSSVTRVSFSTSKGPITVDLNTPPLGVGEAVDLGPINIPGVCFNPDCDFTVTVDINKVVPESNEENNSAVGICPG